MEEVAPLRPLTIVLSDRRRWSFYKQNMHDAVVGVVGSYGKQVHKCGRNYKHT